MKFDPYAALAALRTEGQAGAIHAHHAIPVQTTSTTRTISTPKPVQAKSVQPAEAPHIPPLPSPPESSSLRADAFRHGCSPAGKPLTWTGRIVSLDAWRGLTDWERHGSTGLFWNGQSRQWEHPDGGAA